MRLNLKHTASTTICLSNMQLVTYTVVLVLAITIALLNSWAQNPEASDVERTVMTTAMYSVASGTIANIVCAVVAHATHAVEVGEEMGACSPYGLVGTGIAAKLHLYWIDGYGPEEWEYVRRTPVKVATSLRDGADEALKLVDLDLTKLGLMRPDQDAQGSRP